MSDWDKVVAGAMGASLLAVGYFTAKRATAVGAGYVQARLGKPSLMSVSRVSDLHGMWSFIKIPQLFYSLQNSDLSHCCFPCFSVCLILGTNRKKKSDATKLNEDLQQRLLNLSPGDGEAVYRHIKD